MKKLNFFLPVIFVLFLTCGLFPTGVSNDNVPTIFFVAEEIGNFFVTELYSVKINSAEFTRLTSTGIFGNRQLSLSPDGEKIAYNHRNNIYTMDTDGSNKQQLTFNITAMGPSWSPDGSKIAFFRSVDNAGDQVFLMNVDGSETVQLTDSHISIHTPRWIPDGSQIYYTAHDGLFIMDKDGSNNKQLNDFMVSLSRLWYSSEDRLFNYVERNKLYKIIMDGTGLTLVRSFPEEIIHLNLSPDLKKIAYNKEDDPEKGVYILNFDGSGEKLLARREFKPGAISWSPDSQYILYNDLKNTTGIPLNNQHFLYVIRPDGTGNHFITDRINNYNGTDVFWIF